MTTSTPAGLGRRSNRHLACIAFTVLAAAPVFAANGSWVFLQDNADESLVRLSADGKSLTPVAKGAAGAGMAIDGSGNYIIAARKSLLRVTRTGAVTQIAAAPAGSSWTAVAVDASGSFVAADGMQPAIWRVSADGASVVKVASYGQCCIPLPEGAARILALAIDSSGDYLLLVNGEWYPPGMNPAVPQGVGPEYFYRIAPNGGVTEVPLTGVKLRAATSLVPDGKGGYLVTDRQNDCVVFRLALDGVVAKVTALEISGPRSGLGGAGRNPDTGEVMVIELTGTGRISRSTGEGDRLARIPQRLKMPSAVVWDPGW